MKIVFVTFHNWETKRIGGFHKFAEASARDGNEVVFFSFPRPYYIYLKHEERLNRHVLNTLRKGRIYNIGGGVILTNITWPTLRLPQPLYRWMPNIINHWLNTHSFVSFDKFNAKYLAQTDVFVFESNAGEEIFDLIKKYHPNSKYIYRPSDPRMIDGASEEIRLLEEHVMLKSDCVFIVNKAGLTLYQNKIKDFDKRIKSVLLPNGVDTDKFKKRYPCPIALQRTNTALYVGARVIEWHLILLAAKKCPDINFVIVCPETPPSYFLESSLINLQYIPGIPSDEVAMWVTNCDVYIVPNPKGWYKSKPWGITAKYYQAMAAQRPIIAFDDTDELKQYGVAVAHSYEDFIDKLQITVANKNTCQYNYAGKDWKVVTDLFLKHIKSL